MRSPLFIALLGACALGAAHAGDQALTYGQRVDAALTAAAGEIGGDPAKGLAWVQQATDYEAYRGALRGARGALATGRANDVDQALLLQAVLKPKESRFASCSLSEADAHALSDAKPAPSTPLLMEGAEGLAAQAGDDRTRTYLTALGKAWAALKDLQGTETAALADAATKVGIVFAGPDIAKLAAEAAATHVWLQIKSGEQWVDLDPTLASATPGATRCAATQTFEAVPDASKHRITLALVAELKSAGGVTRKELLHLDEDAAALAGDDVLFYFEEAQGTKTAADEAALKKGAFAYTPVIRVGDAAFEGQALLLAAPKSGFGDVGATATDKVGGATDLIGGMGEPEPTPARPVSLEAEPVAAFLEVTLTSPGEAAVTVRTTVFDRAGAAARAGDLANATLKELAETSGDYSELATIWSLGVLTGALQHDFERPAKAMRGGDIFSPALALSATLRRFERVEGALLRTAGLAPVSSHLRPRLLLAGYSTKGTGDATKLVLGADLAASAAEDAPDASETVAQHAARAVARVLAERLVLGQGGLPAAGAKQPEALAAADLLALSAALRQQGGGFAPADPAFDDADANATAKQSATDGRIVLVPPGLVDVAAVRLAGWWVADAKAGRLYDEMGDGRSSESAEYIETGEPARESVPALQRYACTIRRVIMGSALIIGAATGDSSLTGLAETLHDHEEVIEAMEGAAEGEAGSGAAGAGPGC